MRKHLPSAISSAAIRYALVCGSQAAMFAFAGATAFLLRFDFSIPSNYLRDFVWAVPIWVIVKTLSFQLAKLNRRGWRYVSGPFTLSISPCAFWELPAFGRRYA
jgi:hypothetical protein